MEPNKQQERTGQASVLFIGNDLMFQSKISSACRQAGMSLGVIRNPKVLGDVSISGASISGASMGGSTDEAGVPRLIVVDLGLANLDLAEVLASGRQIWPTTKWLGYGAHVQADRLDSATELGLDVVLTRGQFDRDMVRVLQGFAGDGFAE
jgi:DNA-binding NarL/FixJ family response regulator